MVTTVTQVQDIFSVVVRDDFECSTSPQSKKPGSMFSIGMRYGLSDRGVVVRFSAR
jgi:hypothetical protein